jgi:hypothetical protein
VSLLTNIQDPPRKGNYRVEHGKAIKPTNVAGDNRHIGHFDNADRVANSYKAGLRTRMWTSKLFSQLFDLGFVNSYFL